MDYIARLTAAERSIGATRWGLGNAPERILAIRILQPEVARRICMRGIESGAPQLVPLLVEHGGTRVPRTDALELEAARLEGWFPMESHAEGWSMPRELTSAAASSATVERFFAATMITLLTDEEREELAAELGLPPAPSRLQRLNGLVAAIVALPADESAREAAESTAALGGVRRRDIVRLSPVTGSLGTRYLLERRGELAVEIAPRELAVTLGVSFEPVLVTQAVDLSPREALPAVNVPAVHEIGAIVDFATQRAADEAMRLIEFKLLVVRRLGPRRIAVRPSCTPADVADVLVAQGFHIDPVEP